MKMMSVQKPMLGRTQTGRGAVTVGGTTTGAVITGGDVVVSLAIGIILRAKYGQRHSDAGRSLGGGAEGESSMPKGAWLHPHR